MPDDIQVTLLVENRVQQTGLLAEHGLAYHLRLGKQHLLFDTGQTDLLSANARQLGIDLGEVHTLVLSHGHYDHTGGLAAVRRMAPEARVVMHPAAVTEKFAVEKDGRSRSIGMPQESLSTLSAARVEWCHAHPVQIADGVFATGSIPRSTDLEDVGGRFFLDSAGTQPDPLEDDQALYFECAEGMVVLLGCAHAGVINTLRYVESVTGADRFAAVLGGMHLLNASEARIQFTLEELRQRDIAMLAPLHCTGWGAVLRLWNTFPGQCQEALVGSRFRFRR
jgi:7,8-dihydropterin-6-yl-methyl-4-(beta-D-ribofuranosyl)aminobenzene 5'-phosphate synthase